MPARHPLSDGIMYSTWRTVPMDIWRWDDFTPDEFACNATGEFYWHERTFDSIQQSRSNLGIAHHLNSAHRSRKHNRRIGGAVRSAHLWTALDVSTRNHNRLELYHSLYDAGFRTFGFYESFIHTDHRLGRRWYASQAARQLWEPLLNQTRVNINL